MGSAGRSHDEHAGIDGLLECLSTRRDRLRAWRDIVENDVVHEREDVVASWRETGTWIEPPILLSGSVFGTAVRDYLLVGSTRLGCLLAFLDQQIITESALHQVWVGHCRFDKDGKAD